MLQLNFPILHLSSPILYILYVKSFVLIKPCPENLIMIKIRNYHNISLSFLSLFMLLGISIANYQENKFNSVNNILCKSYNDNIFAKYSVEFFLYSKYLEWLDTLFLHLSNKKISDLQYTHHMSTAILVYLNIDSEINPYVFIPMGINCFVHIFMYWYFAYPKGILYKYRKGITQIQIIQHIICLAVSSHQLIINNCQYTKYGIKSCFFLYLMYLFYFSKFYFITYYKKALKQY